MAQARHNFISALTGEKYDLAEHAALARQLREQHNLRSDDFLVHAPGPNGRGKGWYWLRSLALREFQEAPESNFPRRFFRGASPWSEMRDILGSYGKYVQPQFVVIDTFNQQVEGPLVLDNIRARKNPGHDDEDRLLAEFTSLYNQVPADMRKYLGTPASHSMCDARELKRLVATAKQFRTQAKVFEQSRARSNGRSR